MPLLRRLDRYANPAGGAAIFAIAGIGAGARRHPAIIAPGLELAGSLRSEFAEEAGDPLEATVRSEDSDVDASDRDLPSGPTTSHEKRISSWWASMPLVRFTVWPGSAGGQRKPSRSGRHGPWRHGLGRRSGRCPFRPSRCAGHASPCSLRSTSRSRRRLWLSGHYFCHENPPYSVLRFPFLSR